MPKSPDAFRTISEVADWLGVQAHVLRFWESKFAQVKPIKRAGGRRYYRPADMLLLGGIKKLLHDDGLTIKGTQKLLRENGVAYVADLSQPLDDLTMAVIESDAEDAALNAPETELDSGWETAEMAMSDDDTEAPDDDANADADSDVSALQDIPMPLFSDAASDDRPSDSALDEPDEDTKDSVTEEAGDAAGASDPDDTPSPDHTDDQKNDAADVWLQKGDDADAPIGPDGEPADAAVDEIDAEAAVHTPLPSFRARHRAQNAASEQEEPPVPDTPADELPPEADETQSETAAEGSVTPAAPRQVDVPPVPPLSEIVVAPALLSALSRIRKLTPEHAREIKPHLARLTRLRASMANALKDTHKD